MLGFFIFIQMRGIFTMKAIQRITEVLQQKLGKEIPLQEVGYETMSFTHEEIN